MAVCTHVDPYGNSGTSSPSSPIVDWRLNWLQFFWLSTLGGLSMNSLSMLLRAGVAPGALGTAMPALARTAKDQTPPVAAQTNALAEAVAPVGQADE